MLVVQTLVAELDYVLLYLLGSLCQTGSVITGFQALLAGAAAGDSLYLLPSGGNVGELIESVTVDGGRAFAVGGGHVPEAG